jgi:hypothetical protein
MSVFMDNIWALLLFFIRLHTAKRHSQRNSNNSPKLLFCQTGVLPSKKMIEFPSFQFPTITVDMDAIFSQHTFVGLLLKNAGIGIISGIQIKSSH